MTTLRLLLFLSSVLLLGGCMHRIVRGDPLTLPTLEKGKGAITHLEDEKEAQQAGEVTISQKGWVLFIFDHPFAAPATCNFRDLTAKGNLEIKMSAPDGVVLKGKVGHRVHFACQGIKQ